MLQQIKAMQDAGLIGNHHNPAHERERERVPLVAEMATWSDERMAEYMENVPITCRMPDDKFAEMARAAGPAVPLAYLRAMSLNLGHWLSRDYARGFETGQGIELFADNLRYQAEQHPAE
jgi:hypothetical protein